MHGSVRGESQCKGGIQMKVAESLEAVHTHTHTQYLQNCALICYTYNAMVEFVYSTRHFYQKERIKI